MTTYDRILVVNLGGIGDLVLSVPFLRGLRRSFPASRVELLAATRAAGVVEGLPYFDRLRVMDTEALTPLRAMLHPVGAVGGVSQLARIKARRFDLVVNLMPPGSDDLYGNLHAMLSFIGARRLAGREIEGRAGFYDFSVEESPEDDRHESELQADLLRAMGGEPDRRKRLEITIPSTGELKAAGESLSGLDGPLVGIVPGAGRPTKVWPAGRFAEVMDTLHEEAGASFVMFGGTGDRKQAREVVSRTHAPVVDVCGETTIRGLVALIGRLNMLVSNEAGPMFVAAALGVPTVAVIGPGRYMRFIRDRDSLHPVLGEADCAPCDRKSCDEMTCMKSIPPEDVARAALGLLKPAGGEG